MILKMMLQIEEFKQIKIYHLITHKLLIAQEEVLVTKKNIKKLEWHHHLASLGNRVIWM